MTPAEKRRFLAAAASMGVCARCHRYGVQVAHRDEGKGMGQKTAPWMTAPLCPACHEELGNGNKLDRAERRAEMNRAIVEAHDFAFRNEIFILNPKWRP